MNASHSVAKSSMILTCSAALEFGLQLLIPVILVRHLSSDEFSEYRLLWLVAGGLLSFVPAFMPQSLFYFLPRTQTSEKPVIIGNVICYLMVVGCLAGIFFSSVNPLISGPLRKIAIDSGGFAPVFLALWIVVSINNFLPAAEGRIYWQSLTDVALAIFRTAMLCLLVVANGTFAALVIGLLLDAFLRGMVLLAYLYTREPKCGLRLNVTVLKLQFKYSAPFACSNFLFQLRAQIDQWAVAVIISSSMLGLFAVGAVLLPIAALVKQPLYNSTAPRLSKAFSDGDLKMARLLVKSGLSYTTAILAPLAGGFFLISEQLIEVVYTHKYIDSLPIMKIYLVAIGIGALGTGYVVALINKGGFAVKNNAISLCISSFFSILGAYKFGAVGAAMGSTVALLFSECWAIKTVANSLSCKIVALIPLNTIAWVVPVVLISYFVSQFACNGLVFSSLMIAMCKSAIYVACLGVGATAFYFTANSRKPVGAL